MQAKELGFKCELIYVDSLRLNASPIEDGLQEGIDHATGMTVAEARRQIEAAYIKMDMCVEGLVASLAEVRRAEQLLTPSALAQPAVILLAVSAPSTSWAADDLVQAALPRIAAAVKQVFLAGYSSPNKKENKMKRLYGRGKTKASPAS